MNKLAIVGNTTADSELRTTQAGKSVCTFTVAVNRRKKTEGRPECDYFRVTAWDALAENCAKYVLKGKKVAVWGSVSVRTYQTQNGEFRASMEVTAGEVEFCSPKQESIDKESGMEKVEPEELPY